MNDARSEALFEWWSRHRRDLPWRRHRTPYRVLVAEVMLQQTQAARVADRYEPFLARFPDPASLAAAPLSEVLRAWAGLGYPARARRLRAAAAVVARDGWPRTPSGLERLPGVGPYTAAAMAAFAFGAPVAAVDTNLRRILSRWHGRNLTGAALHAAAAAARREPAADWNEAMMDLGALVCRPAAACGNCPVSAWCAGPDAYVPRRPQPRFEGSLRQARGAVVRWLAEHGPSDASRLVRGTGLAPERVEAAVAALRREGMVAGDGPRHRLAD